MKRFKGWMCVLVGASLALTAADVMAQSVVVYENIANQDLDHGLTSTEEAGNEITLAGDARIVTRLELAIVAFPGSTVPLVVRLYENDGASTSLGLAPSTVLFDSGPIDVDIATDTFGFQVFSVTVPNVTVPDTFTWTIERLDGSGFSLRRFNPPSVGSQAGFLWVRTSGAELWSANSANRLGFNAFYAVVEAKTVSDPITLLADLIGTVVNLNLQKGISNSLDAKLDAALGALDDMNNNNDVAALNTLEAFINAVAAQTGDKISVDDANVLTASAQAIIDLLTL